MKYSEMYMDMAVRLSKESKCPRKQVGCVVVSASGMIAPGFNGHASGGPNEWEWKEGGNPEVVHAELNALGKMLEQGVSAAGATVYVTLSPCLECAKLLVRAKVAAVFYLETYRCSDGLDYLRRYGVGCIDFSRQARFAREWAGRKFRCLETNVTFTVPEDVRETDFFKIGNGFVDVGRLGFYSRFGGNLVEIEEGVHVQ